MARAPQAGGYEQRLGPGGTARLPQAGSEAFGAGVGQAISDLGQSIEQLDLVKTQVRRNEETASFGVAFEQAKAKIDEYIGAQRTGAADDVAPGWAGHTEKVVGEYDQAMKPVLEVISDPKLRRQAELRVLQYRNGIADRERTFEAAKRIDKLGYDTNAMAEVAANRARTTDDPAQLAEILQGASDNIGSYSVAPDIAEKLKDHTDEMIRRGFLEGQVERNPAAARALLDKGAFDDLDPQFLEVKRREISVNENRLRVDAERQARLDKADAVERVGLLVKSWRDDAPVRPEDLEEAKGLIDKYDLGEDKLYDVEKLSAQYQVRRTYRGALPQQISADLSQVEAKIARDGEDASPALIWRRDAMRSMLGDRRAQISNDPYGFAAQNGISVAPLDPADPGSVAARRRVRGQVQRSTGQPVPFFTPDEAERYSALAGGEPRQRGEVAEVLARIGGPDAMQAAEQVAPKDYALQQAVTMPAPLRNRVFEGEALLKANGSLLPRQQARESWAEQASAFEQLPASYRNRVMAAAENLYAFEAAKRGLTEFDEDLFARQIDLAIDPSGKGGMGEWHGKPVKLPYGVTQGEFETRMSRGTFNGAFYKDGTPIPSSVLKSGRWRPVASPLPGRYFFLNDRGEFALVKGGGRAGFYLGNDQ